MKLRGIMFMLGLIVSVVITSLTTAPLLFQDLTNFSGWQPAPEIELDAALSGCGSRFFVLTECSYFYTFPNDTSTKPHVLNYLLVNDWSEKDIQFLRANDDPAKLTVDLALEKRFERTFALFGWSLIVLAYLAWHGGHILLNRLSARSASNPLREKPAESEARAPAAVMRANDSPATPAPPIPRTPTAYARPRQGFGQRTR